MWGHSVLSPGSLRVHGCSPAPPGCGRVTPWWPSSAAPWELGPCPPDSWAGRGPFLLRPSCFKAVLLPAQAAALQPKPLSIKEFYYFHSRSEEGGEGRGGRHLAPLGPTWENQTKPALFLKVFIGGGGEVFIEGEPVRVGTAGQAAAWLPSPEAGSRELVGSATPAPAGCCRRGLLSFGHWPSAAAHQVGCV